MAGSRRSYGYLVNACPPAPTRPHQTIRSMKTLTGSLSLLTAVVVLFAGFVSFVALGPTRRTS